MIHITDFNGDIIDFISKSDGAVTEAEHMINVEDKLETFDFTVLTSRTEHMQKRNRVIIEDKDGQYREFIIYNISSDLNGYTRVQTNSSALEDIKTAKPVAPNKLNKYTVKQALEYALADTGWEVSDEAEWGGTRTTSWTGWHDRISILKQLETTYSMRLSFYVEVGSNKITNRYVSLNKVEPMFNGEEIVYGDNMINLKRTVDFSDIATALICLGPEDSETGKREIVEIKDDDAQAQFGLPYRYIWDIYEPQSSDEKMTRKRLTTLGRTALNKRKQESISYEIDGIGLSASAGDMIRVKNEDFTPELYVDAEVVEVTTDLISGESQYKFGVIKEYTRDDVYARFNAMLSGLRERLNKVVENTDSIISERLEEELKYVERYIEKSPTPPLNPKEGQLWLDTSHDGVAVLKRYENGEWIKSSVSDVKEIGGMTREETMYEALKERLVRNEVNYSEVFKRHEALVSEKHYHYVDEDIKNDLTSRYNALQQSYDDFKQAFNNINAEQPTIGLITTAISRAVEFEARLKEYNDSYYVARKAFDEVFGILQSQYSDEKFNEAMQELAEQIGGEWNGNELVVDGKVHEKFYDVRNELERQNDLLKNTISETEYISDELSKSQSALEQHSYELNTKVSYTEMNGTNKTLEKLLTEFSQTADGFNFRVDSNGMIQDLTFDRNAFKLNSNLIEFNDGDVIIKDGVTTIKDAYIDKLFSKTAFIEQLKAVNITSEQVRVAYNNISNSVQITPTGLETTTNGSLSSRLNYYGHHFYHNGSYVGHIGTGQVINHPTVRGLRLTLGDYGEYMAFSYRPGSLDPDDPNGVAMLWSKGNSAWSRGFHFNEDIKIKHNRVLETYYIRPLNASSLGDRIYLYNSSYDGANGISLKYHSFDGSGIHLANNKVTLIAKDTSKNSVGDLSLAFDSKSYYVRSISVYNRTYSSGANLYITSYGTIGRSTSARKYKLAIENQFKDDNEQLEHSKKILNLNPRTWFDKTEAEIYAEELKTGEKQTDEKFTLKRYFGMIADEFEEIGMKELVSYNDKGEVEGLAYDRIPVHHNVLIKDLYKENDELKKRIEKLEELING